MQTTKGVRSTASQSASNMKSRAHAVATAIPLAALVLAHGSLYASECTATVGGTAVVQRNGRIEISWRASVIDKSGQNLSGLVEVSFDYAFPYYTKVGRQLKEESESLTVNNGRVDKRTVLLLRDIVADAGEEIPILAKARDTKCKTY